MVDDDGRRIDAGALVSYKLTYEPSAQVSAKQHTNIPMKSQKLLFFVAIQNEGLNQVWQYLTLPQSVRQFPNYSKKSSQYFGMVSVKPVYFEFDSRFDPICIHAHVSALFSIILLEDRKHTWLKDFMLLAYH